MGPSMLAIIFTAIGLAGLADVLVIASDAVYLMAPFSLGCHSPDSKGHVILVNHTHDRECSAQYDEIYGDSVDPGVRILEIYTDHTNQSLSEPERYLEMIQIANQTDYYKTFDLFCGMYYSWWQCSFENTRYTNYMFWCDAPDNWVTPENIGAVHESGINNCIKAADIFAEIQQHNRNICST